MRITQEELEKMMRDEYLDAKERLLIWTEAVKEELQDERETREGIYAMMFWSQTELHRRRAYLDMAVPDAEIEGARVLRDLTDRRGEEEERRKEAKREKEAELKRQAARKIKERRHD